MSYKGIIYLISILKRFYYDLLNSIFILGLISLTLQSRKVVHFFFTHPLPEILLQPASAYSVVMLISNLNVKSEITEKKVEIYFEELGPLDLCLPNKNHCRFWEHYHFFFNQLLDNNNDKPIPRRCSLNNTNLVYFQKHHFDNLGTHKSVREYIFFYPLIPYNL